MRDGHWYDNELPDRTQECLRFSRAEVDRSLHENSWARLGWTARFQPCAPRPLPAAWTPGHTTLHTRIGVNLYLVSP